MNKKEELIKYSFAGISTIALIVLVSIFLFLLTIGLQALIQIPLNEFFLNNNWNPQSFNKPSWGILGLMISTLIVTIGALMISIPLGVMTAIYLSEIAHPTTRELLKPIIELIAGIPSVILGLLGIIFLSPLIASLFGISSGLTGLTASIIVGIMVIPTIVSICEEVLTSLPNDFKNASFALGATKWQTIRFVLIPAASSGIIAGIMLGVGRAVGETIAVLMVAGNSRASPTSFFDSVRTMTANIAIEIKEVVSGSLHYQALFAIALILFLITFLINLISDLIIEKYRSKYVW